MNKESSYRHILKYTSLFGGVQGLNILIGLVRNKVIAILLGPLGVGLISIYNTAATFLQNSTNFGLQMSGVREISQAFDSGDEAETNRHIALLRFMEHTGGIAWWNGLPLLVWSAQSVGFLFL